MNIVFAGTPEFAVPTLEALRREGHEITLVVTQPDRPRGRGMKLAAPAVKTAAERLGLPVEQPKKLRGEAGRKILARHKPDAVVIVAYGEIIPGDLLSIPRHGWINLHASLLPKYRGAAPIQRAIINGETVTGVSTMQIDEGMDTGPVLLAREVPIAGEDTSETIAPKLAHTGAELMVETLTGLAEGTLTPSPQDHSQATKAPMLKKQDGRIDWSKPARQLHNLIRGVTPWPGAFTTFRGDSLRILRARATSDPPGWTGETAPSPGLLWEEKRRGEHALYAACGGGTWLELIEVQLAGRNRVPAADFIHGLHVTSGETMSSPMTSE